MQNNQMPQNPYQNQGEQPSDPAIDEGEDIRMMPTMLFSQTISAVERPPQEMLETEKLISQTVQSYQQQAFPPPKKEIFDHSNRVPQSISGTQQSASNVPPRAPTNPPNRAPQNPQNRAHQSPQNPNRAPQNRPSQAQMPQNPFNSPDGNLPPGTIIDGRYRIVNVLGFGGLAVVYRATHLRLEREIAIKVMNQSSDSAAVKRFTREAKIASGIVHRNVVEVFDYGVIPETQQPFMAMELLHGHDLYHEISNNGPLTPKRAFELLRPILDALNVGHKLGVVHKDLKPENLFLVDPGTPNEYLKILDFGVARINSGGDSRLTSAGQIMGTPRFLAPEYILTQQVYPATDVYQMGLIFSEAITGKQAVSNDITQAIQAHCSGTLCIPLCLKKGPVGAVFKKALALNYCERYKDAGEFGAALDSVKDSFENMNIGAMTQTTTGTVTSAKTGESSVANNRMTYILIGAICVLFVGLLMLIFLKVL